MSDLLTLDSDWKQRNIAKKKFWYAVHVVLTIDNPITSKYIDQNENIIEKVNVLSKGTDWLHFISSEWIDIYGALYDESKNFPIDPMVLTKIQKDIHRTFRLFGKVKTNPMGSYNSNSNNNTIKLSDYIHSLERVLLAAASQGRGYTQGINFIAAFFLLHYEGNEKNAFIALSYLLKHQYLDILFDSRCSSLLEYMKVFNRKLRIINKKVYKHLKTTEFSNICYALEWFTTCYIVSCPKNLAFYVMDLLFADVPNILIRLGLAIMNHLEGYILKSSSDELHMNFKNVVTAIDPMFVIPQALLIHFGSSNKSILQKMNENVDKMNPASKEFIDTLRAPMMVEYNETEYDFDTTTSMSTNQKRRKRSTTNLTVSDGGYDGHYTEIYQKEYEKKKDIINRNKIKDIVPSSSNIVVEVIPSQKVTKPSQLLELKRKRHRYHNVFKDHSMEIRKKFNIEITQRMIAYLTDECGLDNVKVDVEAILRNHILSESNNHDRLGLSNQSTNKRKKSRNSVGNILDMFTWSSSSGNSDNNTTTTTTSESNYGNETNSVVTMDMMGMSYFSIDSYTKYRRTLSSICHDYTKYSYIKKYKLSHKKSSYHKKFVHKCSMLSHRHSSNSNRYKNYNFHHHHNHHHRDDMIQRTMSTTPEVSTSSKYLGLDVVVSKSFWMYAFGMKKHMNDKTYVGNVNVMPTHVERGSEESIDNHIISSMSDLGYSSEDEISFQYITAAEEEEEQDEDEEENDHKNDKNSKDDQNKKEGYEYRNGNLSIRNYRSTRNQILIKESKLSPHVKRKVSSSLAIAVESVTNDWFSVKDLSTVLTQVMNSQAPSPVSPSTKMTPDNKNSNNSNSDSSNPNLSPNTMNNVNAKELSILVENDLLLDKPGIRAKRKSVEKKSISSPNRQTDTINGRTTRYTNRLKDFFDGTILSSPSDKTKTIEIDKSSQSCDNMVTIDSPVDSPINHHVNSNNDDSNNNNTNNPSLIRIKSDPFIWKVFDPDMELNSEVMDSDDYLNMKKEKEKQEDEEDEDKTEKNRNASRHSYAKIRIRRVARKVTHKTLKTIP